MGRRKKSSDAPKKETKPVKVQSPQQDAPTTTSAAASSSSSTDNIITIIDIRVLEATGSKQPLPEFQVQFHQIRHWVPNEQVDQEIRIDFKSHIKMQSNLTKTELDGIINILKTSKMMLSEALVALKIQAFPPYVVDPKLCGETSSLFQYLLTLSEEAMEDVPITAATASSSSSGDKTVKIYNIRLSASSVVQFQVQFHQIRRWVPSDNVDKEIKTQFRNHVTKESNMDDAEFKDANKLIKNSKIMLIDALDQLNKESFPPFLVDPKLCGPDSLLFQFFNDSSEEAMEISSPTGSVNTSLDQSAASLKTPRPKCKFLKVSDYETFISDEEVDSEDEEGEDGTKSKHKSYQNPCLTNRTTHATPDQNRTIWANSLMESANYDPDFRKIVSTDLVELNVDVKLDHRGNFEETMHAPIKNKLLINLSAAVCQWKGCTVESPFKSPEDLYSHVSIEHVPYNEKGDHQEGHKRGKHPCQWNNCDYKAVRTQLLQHVDAKHCAFYRYKCWVMIGETKCPYVNVSHTRLLIHIKKHSVEEQEETWKLLKSSYDPTLQQVQQYQPIYTYKTQPETGNHPLCSNLDCSVSSHGNTYFCSIHVKNPTFITSLPFPLYNYCNYNGNNIRAQYWIKKVKKLNSGSSTTKFNNSEYVALCALETCNMLYSRYCRPFCSKFHAMYYKRIVYPHLKNEYDLEQQQPTEWTSTINQLKENEEIMQFMELENYDPNVSYFRHTKFIVTRNPKTGNLYFRRKCYGLNHTNPDWCTVPHITCPTHGQGIIDLKTEPALCLDPNDITNNEYTNFKDEWKEGDFFWIRLRRDNTSTSVRHMWSYTCAYFNCGGNVGRFGFRYCKEPKCQALANKIKLLPTKPE